MDNKAYYELLGTLPKGKMNSVGFVVGGNIPFKRSSQGAVYALERDLSLEYNPEKCRSLAIAMTPEVEYLLAHVEKMKEKAQQDMNALIKQRDAIKDIDLLTHIRLENIQRDIDTTHGQLMSLFDVWQLLNGRKYELWECSRIKEEPT